VVFLGCLSLGKTVGGGEGGGGGGRMRKEGGVKGGEKEWCGLCSGGDITKNEEKRGKWKERRAE